MTNDPPKPSDATENLLGSRTKSAKEFLAAKNAKIAKKISDAKRSL